MPFMLLDNNSTDWWLVIEVSACICIACLTLCLNNYGYAQKRISDMYGSQCKMEGQSQKGHAHTHTQEDGYEGFFFRAWLHANTPGRIVELREMEKTQNNPGHWEEGGERVRSEYEPLRAKNTKAGSSRAAIITNDFFTLNRKVTITTETFPKVRQVDSAGFS